MKKKDIEKMLRQAGYWLHRSTKHEAWTNGLKTVFVPHAKELKSWTVHKILKEAGLTA